MKVFEGSNCVRLELKPWIGLETIGPTIFSANFRVTADEDSNWLPWVIACCHADINAQQQQPYQIDDVFLAYDGRDWSGNVIGKPGYDPHFQADLQACIQNPNAIPRGDGGSMRFSRLAVFQIAASMIR